MLRKIQGMNFGQLNRDKPKRRDQEKDEKRDKGEKQKFDLNCWL